jgi:uncharacterized protein YqeY
MTTQKILEDIKTALKRGKPIPTGDVRSLLAICQTLADLVSRQQTEIAALKAALPKPDPEGVIHERPDLSA